MAPQQVSKFLSYYFLLFFCSWRPKSENSLNICVFLQNSEGESEQQREQHNHEKNMHSPELEQSIRPGSSQLVNTSVKRLRYPQ